MATITQRLAFLISANADQAIKAFDKTAIAAEKQMGKAGKSIDKLGASMTKFGAAGLAAAGTLGAGLFKLAQGAIADQQAQALLAEQLRASTDATNAQINAVEEMIDATARASGIADDQLRPAFSSLVRTFGDVDKASKVLNTALDLSRATGRELETVVLALARASSGSTGALSRLGITFDENVKKSKDFDLILATINNKVGGASAAYAETYAGKLDRVKVAVGEAGEAIGAGFVPVIEDISNLIVKGVGIFDDFNETTDGLTGKVLAFGTVGLGAVSALSLVGGQAIKVRNILFALDETTGKSTMSMTKLGKAMVGASLIIGGAAVVYQAYSNTKAEAEERTTKLADALKLEGDAQRAALIELVKNDERMKTHADTLNLLGLTFTDFEKAVNGGATEFDNIRVALERYQKELGYAGATERFAAAIGYQGKLTVGQINLIQRLTDEVDRQIKAQDDAANAYDSANRALGDLGYAYTDAMMRGEDYQNKIRDFLDEQAGEKYNAIVQARKDALEAQAEADKKAAAAAEDFKQSVIEQARALKDNLATALDVAKTKLGEALAAYNAYQKSVSSAVTNTLDLGAAQQTATTNAETIAAAQAKVTDAMTKYDEASKIMDGGKAAAEAQKELADATTALNEALKQPVDFMSVYRNQETAAKAFAGNIQKLLDLGADQTVIDQLLAAGATTGNEIAIAILNGADPKGQVAEINKIVSSTEKIADDLGTNAAEKYFSNGVTLAENLVAGVNSVLKKAKIKLKWTALDRNGKPLKRLNNLSDLFQSEISGMFETAGAGDEVPQLANGGVVRARQGGTLALLGEGGRDEAVIPLPASGQLGTTINVNVSAGMGANGTEIGRMIVDELIAYQRRVGALPIKVG